MDTVLLFFLRSFLFPMQVILDQLPARQAIVATFTQAEYMTYGARVMRAQAADNLKPEFLF